MSGYVWAKTAAGELLVVLVTGGKGYVPGVESAIDMTEIDVLEPVTWPTGTIPQSRNSALPKPGALAAGAIAGSNILRFVANG